MKVTFDESTNSYKITEGEAPAQTAELESSAGVLGRVSSMDVMGIPLGQAVVGGGIAILVDRMLLERIDPAHKWGPWALLGGAWAVKKFGHKYLGGSADAAALILAYEAVADWVSSAIDKVAPAKAAASQGRMAAAEQASTQGNYYNSLMGSRG